MLNPLSSSTVQVIPSVADAQRKGPTARALPYASARRGDGNVLGGILWAERRPRGVHDDDRRALLALDGARRAGGQQLARDPMGGRVELQPGEGVIRRGRRARHMIRIDSDRRWHDRSRVVRAGEHDAPDTAEPVDDSGVCADLLAGLAAVGDDGRLGDA